MKHISLGSFKKGYLVNLDITFPRPITWRKRPIFYEIRLFGCIQILWWRRGK